MAGTQESEEELFEDIPKGLSKGQMKTAWNAREFIWRLATEGKSAPQMMPQIHAPIRAIEWVMERDPNRSAPPEADAGAAGTGGSGAGEPAPIPPGVPEGATMGPPASKGGGGPPPAGRPPLPEPQAPPIPISPGGPDLSHLGEPVPGPRYGAKFEVPDMYRGLYNLCVGYGLQPYQAEGIVWSFENQADPNDLNALRRILTISGKNKLVVEAIVNGWATLIHRMGDEGIVPNAPRTAKESLEDVRRKLGFGDADAPTDPMMMAVEDLEKQRLALDIEKTRAEIAERQRQVRDRAGGGGMGPGDDYEDIIVMVNGVPTSKRIPSRELGKWAPFIAKPPDQKPADEIPPWAKQIMADQAEDRRLREEERRQHDADERIARVLNERLGPIEARLRQSPEESEQGRELRALREQLANRSADDLKEWQRRMEDLVRQGMSYEAAERRVQEEDNRAIRRGFVPRGSVAKLEEEQVQLEAERESAKNKNNAQARAFDVVAKKAEASPLTSMAREAGLPKLAGEFVKQRMGSAPENQGQLVEQSPEHLAQRAAELEAAQELTNMSAATPPPPPQRRDGGESSIDLRQ